MGEKRNSLQMLKKYGFRAQTHKTMNYLGYIITTCEKYKVNLLSWAENYADNFFGYEHLWPTGSYDKKEYGNCYNPIKVKKNKFNIDSIYSQISTLPYIKGKKKILEILIMYYWQAEMAPIDEEIYEKYMEEACGSI